MTKAGWISKVGIIVLVILSTSCTKTGVDIRNEAEVLSAIQGTWVGYEQTGDFYTHVKLYLSENNFSAWMQTSDSAGEPEWAVLPDETGTFSLSNVLEPVNEGGAYRKLTFKVPGRCCGDKSIAIRNLSSKITFNAGKGLCFAHQLLLAAN
jgi:hypothetical protein